MSCRNIITLILGIAIACIVVCGVCYCRGKYQNYSYAQADYSIQQDGGLDKEDVVLDKHYQSNVGDLLTVQMEQVNPFLTHAEKGKFAIDAMRFNNLDFGERHQILMAARINDVWQP